MAVHVINEARRCLQCKKPLCQLKGCPIKTNVPEMIRLFLDGKTEEAGKMLFDNNPLSVVCSLVCDHEHQCEGNCIQGKRKDGAAIQIPNIENYISDSYFDRIVLNKAPDTGKQVAIIGAGPAGITMAIKLAEKGHNITIFERMDKVGGMMRYGIPAFRRKILDRYQSKLREMGIHFRPNTSIGGALHLDDLFNDGYDAVFIGTGVWRPNRTHCKGESLGNVHFAVDYLQNPEAYDLGDTVAIIGAGNSAIDVARTVVRQGSRNVTLYARRQRIAASQRELDYAAVDGIDIQQGMAIKEFTPEGPIFIPRTFDDEGNCIHEDEPVLMKDKIVNTAHDLKINEKGLIVIDEDGRTSIKGVFASGDVVAGSKNVVLAVAYSKKVADAMDEYLRNKQ